MKYVSSIAFLCLLSSATAARADGYNAMRAKAAAQKSDLVVLACGTADWDKHGQAIKRLTFADTTWLAALPKGVLATCVEVPDNSSGGLLPQSSIDELRRLGRDVPAQAADAKANPDSEFNQGLVWNFPAFLYQDHAGRLIGRVEGLSSQTVKPAGVVAKTRQLRQVSLKYTAMLDKANAATGITKARMLGQALDLLDFPVARTHAEVLQAMRAADPNDESGYVTKYTYNLWDFGSEIAALASQKKFAEGRALIAKNKAKSVLTTEQKQAVEVQRYVLCRFWPGQEAEAEEALKTAMAMDPKSDTGLGCLGVLRQIAQDKAYKRQCQAVLDAEKAMDAAAYARLGEETLASTAWMPFRAKNLGRSMPEFTRPSGALLSKAGMLSFSSPPSDNADHRLTTLRPLVLRDEEPGLFVMAPSVRPWAQVSLPKEATLTGIVVINRLDNCRDFQLPLVVGISRDGKTWEEIYRSEEVRDCWRISVPAGLKARHVRVGRESPNAQYFNLSNILVYGNP